MDSANTLFVLLSTALVALMTPGLAFFYGGLVGRRNVLSIMMQSFISMGVVSVLWFLIGFSLAFGTDHAGFIGGLDYVFMRGVDMTIMESYGIPFMAFFVFQMMFAVITPALITGAFADRMTFKSYLLFLVAWSLLVYAPLAHWVWGGGFLSQWGAIDFAGGTVVHISAGMAALASVFVLGRRKQANHLPHNVPYVALGTALLWFGWYGFNAGSALAVNEQATYAFVNSEMAASMAMVTWLFLGWLVDKKPSLIGAFTGVLAGLVAITPAAGFVAPWAALIIGMVASVVSFFAVKLRIRWGWDDALDVWGVHGMSGVVGSLLTGVFATASIGPVSGWIEGNFDQVLSNVYATGVAVVYAFVVTYGLLKAMSWLMPVRVSEEVHHVGLDFVLHGEFAYDSVHHEAEFVEKGERA